MIIQMFILIARLTLLQGGEGVNGKPLLYRGCQKNVPIEDRFSATNPYAAILFSEHYTV